jgi:predicted MPP superfamily phosphohydrolase
VTAASVRVRRYIAAVVVVAFAAVVTVGYRNATADPLVRRLTVEVPDYPADAPPVRILLFSDLHVHGPDMPPARVDRIVGQINALQPDIIVGAGDFVGNHLFGRDYSVAEAVAPLGRLKARLGVIAVLGNNDYEAGGTKVTAALNRLGIDVLVNQAVAIGPIAFGGFDGRVYPWPQLKSARAMIYGAMASTAGVKVLVSHRPDEGATAPGFVRIVLAGHTHCGQIVLPLFGPVWTGSDYGRRYFCGVIREGSRIVVVTAGLGTSHVPLRIGAPPDMWLIEMRGPAKGQLSK